MITKGTPHNNGVKLANYLITGKRGERAELFELRGFLADNIKDAFRDVHIMAEGTKAVDPFFHVQVRNPEGETLDRHQWEYTANRIERMLGLGGQPRAIAFHIDERTGHEHMHVAWSRIDEDKLIAIPLPFYKERLKKISRELEMHFGLTLVRNERDSSIKFAPTRAEEEQARRLGLDIHEIRQTVKDCFEHSDCGPSFEAALANEGLILTRGDRRDFVVIDQEGGMHVLGKRILGVPASEIRDRLADLSRESLPTVEQAREFLREQREHYKDKPVPERMPDADLDELAWQDALARAAIEKEEFERQFVEPKTGDRKNEQPSPFEPPHAAEPPQINRTVIEDAARATTPDARCINPPENLKGDAAHIWASYNRSHDPAAFVKALDERGILLGSVTKEEADRSHREAAFAKEIGRFNPEYREGEIVAVSETARVYKLNERTTGDDRADVDKFLTKLDRSQLPGINATKQVIHERAEAREAYAKLSAIVNPVKQREPRKVDPRPRPQPARTMGRDSVNAPTAVGKAAERGIGKAFDALANLFESLFTPPLTPEQKREAAIVAQERQAEKQIEFAKYTADLADSQRRQEQQHQVEQQRDEERKRQQQRDR